MDEEVKYIRDYWITCYGSTITSIKIQCPHCGMKFRVEAISQDQAHYCGFCGGVFIETGDPQLRIPHVTEDSYPPCGLILNELN
jgi:uncharacterized paraquat-inducible protein A